MAPERIRKPTSTTKMRKAMRQNTGADHEHGHAGDQVVLIFNMLIEGNQHVGQQRGAAGEDEAVDSDDNRRPLQVLQLGVFDFAVDLRQRLLAAHGKNRVAKGHENAEQAHHRKQLRHSAQKSQGVVAKGEMKGIGDGGR